MIFPEPTSPFPLSYRSPHEIFIIEKSMAAVSILTAFEWQLVGS
jgi:hypothetical protein